jgi:hypothetical protein
VPDITASLFRILGRRATRTPWSYTGDPEKQITKWHNNPKHRA